MALCRALSDHQRLGSSGQRNSILLGCLQLLCMCCSRKAGLTSSRLTSHFCRQVIQLYRVSGVHCMRQLRELYGPLMTSFCPAHCLLVECLWPAGDVARVCVGVAAADWQSPCQAQMVHARTSCSPGCPHWPSNSSRGCWPITGMHSPSSCRQFGYPASERLIASCELYIHGALMHGTRCGMLSHGCRDHPRLPARPLHFPIWPNVALHVAVCEPYT